MTQNSARQVTLPGRELGSTMTDTPAAISAQGWVSGPKPDGVPGVMLSNAVCHLGGFFFGGFGLPSSCTAGSRSRFRPMPMASFGRRGLPGSRAGLGRLLPADQDRERDHDASDSSHADDARSARLVMPRCGSGASIPALTGQTIHGVRPCWPARRAARQRPSPAGKSRCGQRVTSVAGCCPLAIVIAFTVLVTGNNPPKPSTAPSLAPSRPNSPSASA